MRNKIKQRQWQEPNIEACVSVGVLGSNLYICLRLTRQIKIQMIIDTDR